MPDCLPACFTKLPYQAAFYKGALGAVELKVDVPVARPVGSAEYHVTKQTSEPAPSVMLHALHERARSRALTHSHSHTHTLTHTHAHARTTYLQYLPTYIHCTYLPTYHAPCGEKHEGAIHEQRPVGVIPCTCIQ